MTRKNLLFIASGAAAVALAVGMYQWNKPHRDVAAEEATATYTAEALYDAFAATGSGANPLLNRVVVVTGTVTAADSGSVTLEGGVTGAPGLSVEVGAQVAIKGRVVSFDDMINNEVRLDNCTLAEE